jgi:hypothetical protein
MNRSATPAETAAACRLDPLLRGCLATLARQKSETGPSAASDWLAAARARPRDHNALIEAALAAETGGDPASAERLLIEAARTSRLWLPRWSLASFYLRHQRLADFWPWLRLALERSHGDRRALFRLCHQAGADTPWLLRDILPADPLLRYQYLDYLLADGLLDGFEFAALQYFDTLPAASRRRYAHVLRWAADALLLHDRAPAALDLWNRLAEAGIVPYEPWREERPLTNGSFQPPLKDAGFDWRLVKEEGVETAPGSPPGILKIRLSGRQPESVVLLRQAVWLPAHRAYRFRCQALTRGWDRRDSSVYWRVGLPGGARADSAPGWVGSGEWETVEMRIPPRPAAGLVWVELAAERRAGLMRPEGEAWLRAAILEPGS